MEQIFQGFAGVPHINIQIVSYLSGSQILELRQVCKAFKNFIDQNLKYIYNKKRKRNNLFEKITFTKIIYNNIELFKQATKLFAMNVLRNNFFSQYQSGEISRFLDDFTVFDLLTYMNKGLKYYDARELINWDPEKVKKFLYLYDMRITSCFYCKIISNKFNYSQIDTFIYLKKEGITDYYCLEVAEKCLPGRKSIFMDLISRNVTEYYALCVVSEFDDKQLAQFSILHSYFNINMYYNYNICKYFTKDQIISFLISYKNSNNIKKSYNEILLVN